MTYARPTELLVESFCERRIETADFDEPTVPWCDPQGQALATYSLLRLAHNSAVDLEKANGISAMLSW